MPQARSLPSRDCEGGDLPFSDEIPSPFSRFGVQLLCCLVRGTYRKDLGRADIPLGTAVFDGTDVLLGPPVELIEVDSCKLFHKSPPAVGR